MKARHLYLDMIISKITGGSSMQLDILPVNAIRTAYDFITTHKKQTKVLYVTNIPFLYVGNILDTLITTIKKVAPSCEVSYSMIDQQVDIDVQSRIFITRHEKVSQQYEQLEELYQSLSVTEKKMNKRQRYGLQILTFGKKDVIEVHDLWESYNIIENKMLTEKYLKKCTIYVHITYKQAREFQLIRGEIHSIFKTDSVDYTWLKTKMRRYLASCNPAAPYREIREHPALLLAAEHIAQLAPIRQEGIVNSEGMILAYNYRSKSPFLFHPSKSQQAQINLIIGEAGSGKSYLSQGINLGAALFNIHNMIIDYKGTEHTELRHISTTEIISCDKVSPRVPNLFRIDDVEINSRKEALEHLNNQADYITHSLIILSDKLNSSKEESLRSIIRSATIAYYNSQNISVKNPETFKETRYMSYKGLLPFITDLLHSDTIPVEIKKELEECIYTLTDKITTDPLFTEMEKNEITLQEIMDKQNVVFCLNKLVKETLDNTESFMVYLITVLILKKSLVRKGQGLHTHITVEEVQLFPEGSDIIQLIIKIATAMRSGNIMLTVLMNSVERLDRSDMAGLTSNVKTVIAGEMKRKDIDKLCSLCDAEQIREDLELIAKESSEYQYVFAIKCDTGYQKCNTLIQSALPPDMNKLFRTRTETE